ncbi:hypothetical protein CEE75_05520 [Lactobacillus crispatus]|uniref:Uncharacterized protein n=1 Tax=Lactobacillus crispatus TaxID=47770 RepID=A0A4R6CTL3_9LACO|nr:hypothetical protein CEE95_04410 [Lactobacillus crispatus]TDM96605.1 hypothetical protein CEE89_04315 [Lactobacillus crispatus]TDN07598.1 hypothetical protein CEE83_14425 [Lactobacillus crispatus]TDN31711.1 hypothetical protein CEE75_05520 [Lactobacillus crispatus]TDN34381.1 hypothetical protein CEE74_04355 [Lactobacillus crispatus]
MMKSIIYFTKEDGQKKILSTMHISGEDLQSIDYVSPELMNFYTKKLGHKPTNIYIFIDGSEFRLLE